MGTAGLCQFEVFGIFGLFGLPTISKLCGRHRWLAPVILAGLGVHLYWRELGGKPAEEW